MNEAQVLFLLQDRARLGIKVRRNDDFTENFTDYFRNRLAEPTVADDYAAKRRLLVGGICFVPRLAKVGIRADPAWVRVLENRDSRESSFP